MKSFFSLSIVALLISGCTATWNGVKEDTGAAADWTKKQVNDGATYIQEKTK